jgi:hypothetical protein
MKIIGRTLVTALAVVVALTLAPASASAFVYFPFHPPKSDAIPTYPKFKKYHHFHHKAHKPGSSGTHQDSGPGGRHGLTPLQGYVTAGMFCSAIWLIIHAAYVSRTENRELTRREAYMDVAGCWLPIIGPLLVNQNLPANY